MGKMNRSDGCLSPKVQLLLLGSLLTVPAKVIPAQTGPPVGTVQPPAGLAQPGAVDLVPVEEKVEEAGDAESLKITFDNVFGGTLEVGGAMRVNYTIGDYVDEERRGGGTRGDGGSFSLDIFRVDLDYRRNNFLGKAEYRFYPGYQGSNSDTFHFVHTAWLGYEFVDESRFRAGINRVPFGPGPYGVSQSWLFDQHYYVGLADDMDLGFKYTKPSGNWVLDLGYYLTDEGNGTGNNFSKDSVRYSYDVVDESGRGYKERNQFNARLIYSFGPVVRVDFGGSVQYGMLESNGLQDDGSHYAGSLHLVKKWEQWTLAAQLSSYHYDVDAAQPLESGELVQFGAYDFPSLVAAEAWVPAISLSRSVATPDIDWIDYLVPYAEYSVVAKEASAFNDSRLIVLGTAVARRQWYVYLDLAFSDGNDFVGNEGGFGDTTGVTPGSFTSNRLGANPDADWQTRFNINFGYYF